MKTPAIDRFERRVHRSTDGCWLWTGWHARDGYGRIKLEDGRMMLAHRFGYEAWVGPIPEGLVLDHLCRNRACVNPAHLEPVTGRENILRGTGFGARSARATHCPKGHAYTPENTIVRRYNGQRVCRECRRQIERVRRATGKKR